MEKVDLEILKFAIDHIPLHVVITDIDAKIIYANNAVEKITGYSNEEVIGQNPRLWGGLMDKEFYKTFWKIIKEEKRQYVGIIQNKRKNGKVYYAALKVEPVIKEGELIGFCGIEQDISEIQSLSDEFDLNQRQKEMLMREINALKSY